MQVTTTYDTVIRVEQDIPAKRSTSVRLADTGRERIADRAQRADVEFSHMVRRMLAYADRHMPDDWTPAKERP